MDTHTHTHMQGCTTLSRGLQTSSSLTTLHMDNCGMWTEAASALCSVIASRKEPSPLMLLNLRRNFLGIGEIAINCLFRIGV